MYSPLDAKNRGSVVQFEVTSVGVILSRRNERRNEVQPVENRSSFCGRGRSTRDLAELCKPDRMITTCRILNGVCHHVEAMLFKQRTVFCLIQTAMIERLSLVAADCFTVRGPACKHQRCVRHCMFSEYGKHPALVIGTQMEETVPGQNPIEAAPDDNMRMSATIQSCLGKMSLQI